jgi:hypothetical protein
MNPSPQEPRRTSRLFENRWLRRCLAGFGALAALVGIFYAEEDWRGRKDWNQYREATEARGESLDLRSYIPKPVPDDQNFCATPVLKSTFQTNYRAGTITSNFWYRASLTIAETNIEKDRAHRHFTDLAAWQLALAALQSGPLKAGQFFETTNTSLAARAAAAPAVLEGLEPDAPIFAELRAASARPYAQCPVAYDLEKPMSILFGNFSRVRDLCRRLDLKACAELAAGQTDEALADVKLILALHDSFKSQPYLISYLLRVAGFGWAIQPVWEGLAEHRWTDAQLQELQACFLAHDFLDDLDQALKSGRAAEVPMFDRVKRNGLGLVADMWMPDSLPAKRLPREVFQWIGWVMPAGWYDQEKLNYCKQFDNQLNGAVDFAGKTISPHNAASEAGAALKQLPGSVLKATLRHKLVAAMLLRLGPLPERAARQQTCANQAAIACALERYRLANGHFPETLSALTPQFMSRPPNDVIGGQPYKYRRTKDGNFILYSVGWNEKDDGGAPGKTLFDQTQGDWVWEYPAE